MHLGRSHIRFRVLRDHLVTVINLTEASYAVLFVVSTKVPKKYCYSV